MIWRVVPVTYWAVVWFIRLCTFIYVRGYPSRAERDKRLKAAQSDPEFRQVVIEAERDEARRLIVKAHNIDMVPSGPQTAIAIKP